MELTKECTKLLVIGSSERLEVEDASSQERDPQPLVFNYTTCKEHGAQQKSRHARPAEINLERKQAM